MSSINKDDYMPEILPFEMKKLPRVYQEKARRELNESQEAILLGLQELREKAKVSKITCDTTFVDDFLVQFLRHRKFDVDRAFKQLANFSKFWQQHVPLFDSIHVKLYDSPAMKYVTILPRRCPDGCTMVLFELGKWDPYEVPFEDFERMAMIVFLQSLRDPMTQINGFKIIHDFTNTGLKHMRYCTPGNLYLFYHGGINCFPGRCKQIHLVNNNIGMKATWAIMRPFLPHKIRCRVLLNSSPADLLGHFPASVLPVQYGGDLVDYHMTDWMNEANDQQKTFTLSGQRNLY